MFITPLSHPPRRSSTPIRPLALGVATLMLVASGCAATDDGGQGAPNTSGQTDAEAPPVTPAPTDAPTTDPPATAAPTTAAPTTAAPTTAAPTTAAPTTAAPTTAPRVPTVVIGQDENGDDIVIEMEISEACAMTFHEPLDSESLSFIRWAYDAPGLEPGTVIRVIYDDGTEYFTAVTPDRKIVFEQGISSYGDYPFPEIEWNSGAETQSTISVNGSHIVDDKEREPSLTCVS